MAHRSTRRLALDLGFVAVIIACGVTASAMGDEPAMPSGVCRAESGGPRYDALLADHRISIAVLFGDIDGGPADHNAWSHRAFSAALRERGFREVAPDHFALPGAIPLDVTIIRVGKHRKRIGQALTTALAQHEVVYYNGHSVRGKLAFDLPRDYRVLVLDTCWSTQLYSPRLVDGNHDVIANTKRSVTGSIESFLVVLDGLQARDPSWTAMVGEMNELATLRARSRALVSRFKDAEDYRLDVRCGR